MVTCSSCWNAKLGKIDQYGPETNSEANQNIVSTLRSNKYNYSGAPVFKSQR